MSERDDYKSGTVCDECAARHGGICAALSPEQLDKLRRHAHRHTVDPGATLLDPASTDERSSVILAGAVKLLKMLPDGRQQIVGIQYAPDFLGRPYLEESDITAEPVTETRLCSFRRADIEGLIAKSPELEHRLYMQALAELEDARELLLTLGRRTARERVAAFLLFVARHSPPTDPTGDAQPKLKLLLTRSEIADFLGLTIETVSRQLHQLEADGVVRLEHKRSITILDTERLRLESGEFDGASGPDQAQGSIRPSKRA